MTGLQVAVFLYSYYNPATNMQPNLELSLYPGLDEEEVLRLRSQGLGNTAPSPTGRTYWEIFSENVFTFINGVLFFLGVALASLGRPGDAIMSTGIITMNVLVSVVQEIRAKRVLDRIALVTRPTANVIRGGQEKTVLPEELVVGDLLVVRPGDQVVVDGQVMQGRLQVDESLLTGESGLVLKTAGDPLYSGSFCTTGSALFSAQQVGNDSFANQITSGARAFRRIQTPLQQEINLVIRIILLVVIYIEFLQFFNALVRQVELVRNVQNSTLIAGLVPNGLLLSISVAYALGAVRIARKGALVQQANSIESLSNVDVLCLDKTGTLTTNRLELHELHPLEASRDELEGLLGDYVRSGATGNQTSAAILAGCPGQRRPISAEVPFSSARKWSALAYPDGSVFALGAPEMLLRYLVMESSQTSWEKIQQQVSALAVQGLRVVLFAGHPGPASLVDEEDDSRLPYGMLPLGLVSLSDELRPEAAQTLENFQRAGVQLKIISGDSPETVASLACQAGFGPAIRQVSGPELERMGEEEFSAAARQANVFGRISPSQKERLVRALRQAGHYVAMIGDGVNDVLSLKQANLAIAMQGGSQATRSVADMILLNDSFAVLPNAVEEGQRILNAMQDILKLFLSRILTSGLVILSALVIGEFPIALRQGTLVTLFSVGIPGIMLAYWAQPGHTPPLLVMRKLWHFVIPASILTSIIALMLFYGSLLWLYYDASGFLPGQATSGIHNVYETVLPVAQTAMVTFLAFSGLFNLIFAEPPTPWWVGADALCPDRRPTYLALALMGCVLCIHLFPGLRALFALTSLDAVEIGLIVLATSGWLFLVRWVWRRAWLERFLQLPIPL
jgi:cation-transporting ATPase E